MLSPEKKPLMMSANDWGVLEVMAADAGCEPEEYIFDGLMATFDAAKILFYNRSKGRDQTLLLLQQEDGRFDALDLVELLVGIGPLEPAPDIGVEDPFHTDQEIGLELEPNVREELDELSSELHISPATLLASAIDLRRHLQIAGQNGRMVLLGSPAHQEYVVLPTEFRSEE